MELAVLNSEYKITDAFCALFSSDISSSGTNDLSGKDKTTAYIKTFVVSDVCASASVCVVGKGGACLLCLSASATGLLYGVIYKWKIDP